MKTDHPEPDEDVQVFVCPRCGKQLRSNQSLKTHRKFFCHSKGKRFVSVSISETGDIQSQKFESSFSGNKFLKPDAASINIHLPY